MSFSSLHFGRPIVYHHFPCHAGWRPLGFVSATLSNLPVADSSVRIGQVARNGITATILITGECGRRSHTEQKRSCTCAWPHSLHREALPWTTISLAQDIVARASSLLRISHQDPGIESPMQQGPGGELPGRRWGGRRISTVG